MPRKAPFQYKISDMISEYNQSLYEEVKAKIDIKLVKNTGNWSAHIDDEGCAIIGYCKSEYPDAAFAHELLHIKAELNGLRDPHVRSSEENITWEIIRFLINQLAHHRIYPEFYELGFSEDEFLNDNDFIETRILLRRDVPKIEALYQTSGKKLEGLIILLPYLVCISPNEYSQDIEAYKKRIIDVSDSEFITEITEIISEWTLSNRMDYCLTLAKLLKACGKLQISFAPQHDIDNEISAYSV